MRTRLHAALGAGGAEALFRDAALLRALADLASADPAGFAAARASLGGKVSLRDLDNALRPLRPRRVPACSCQLPAASLIPDP